MSSSDNFYNILEVPDTASIDEIKKSYRKLSMIYHKEELSSLLKMLKLGITSL